MKTKSMFATLLLAVAVVFNACSGLPDGATNEDMKVWIFCHSLSDELGDEYKTAYASQLKSEIISEEKRIIKDSYVDVRDVMLVRFFESKFNYNVSKNVEDFDFAEILLLSMLDEVYFKYNDEENWLEFLNRKRFEKFAKEEVWDDAPLSDSDFKKLIKSMTDDQYDEGMRNIYRGFLSYLKDLAVDNVEVVDYTMSDFGDSYTKYDIIYSVGEDLYAKVSFIDMEKRYEWELVKTATRLNEILK